MDDRTEAAGDAPVAWQFFQDGAWHTGMGGKHRADTEAGGIPTRDLFPAQQPNSKRATLYGADLLLILHTLQDGECSKSRAAECIDGLLAGAFKPDWLPENTGYFGMDDVPAKVCAELRKDAELAHAFINAAAGEGLVLDGVDAGDLYLKLYPERYAKAIEGLSESIHGAAIAANGESK